MIMINKNIPEYCAKCPMLIVHRGEDFMPTYLCKLEWRKIDGEYICKERAGFCPIKELVECKDCKNHGTIDCPMCEEANCTFNTADDWFCADGVMKNDETRKEETYEFTASCEDGSETYRGT